MGKRAAREKVPAKGSRRERKMQLEQEMSKASNDEFHPRQARRIPRCDAMTEAQAHYMMSIESKQLTFGTGPAGTGKTYCCTVIGARLLEAKRIEKLIVTRPAVEAGRGMGFLPGSIEEKFAPYFAPFKHILEQCFGPSKLEYLVKTGAVEIAPLEYIRGLTFDNAFVILDEAQNTTPTQMKLFLTRLGEHGRAVVNGDTDQKDIEGLSGLEDAVSKLNGLGQVGICEFTEDDVVRSGLVKDILLRYRKAN